METKKNTSTQNPDKMTRVQKVIVILTAVILAIILIVVAATRFMGGSDPYPIGNTSDTVTDTTGDTSGNTTSPVEEDEAKGTTPGETTDTSDSTGADNTGTTPPDTSSDGGNRTDDTDGKQDDTGKTDGKENDGGDTDNGKNPGGDTSSDTDSGNTDKGLSDTEGGNDDPDDGKSGTQGGITDGSSVTIVSIGSSTIEFRIGNETVVIPVQTTVFNGRVTKSGVISDSLNGYSVGASIMLYYPEDNVPDGITLTGAYVKADNTRLTVSADYNGDGTKAVFRLNGVKLP